MANLYFTKEGLPVISLKDFFHGDESSKLKTVEAFREACETVGCFLIADHGVDWKIVDNCINDSKAFFALPTEEKLKFKNENVKEDRGYIPFETQNVNAFMGRSGYPNDPVEKLSFGPNKPSPFPEENRIYHFESWAPNIFPVNPPSLKDNISCYLETVTSLAENLMEIFSVALSMPKDYIFNHCNKAPHSFKINYYPIVDQPKPNQERFPEHTDSTPFTIVCPDQSENCLMIRNVHGDWIYANAPPRTFFINLGDCMARWTNDKWVATLHKVVFPPKEMMTNRVSLVFFVLMNREAVINCIPYCLDANGKSKYEPITYYEFTLSKMNSLASSNVY